MESLEENLEKSYAELEVSEKNQGSIGSYLNFLKLKDQKTYEHSVRTGLLGVEVAKHASLDEKAMLYAGLLHDVGKILIRTELLKKTGKFTKKEMKEMEKHVEYGYKLLSDIHDFSAEIALRHHKYQKHMYPKKAYKSSVKFSKGTVAKIDTHARIFAVIDFYDAVTNRDNERFGKKLSTEEAKQALLSSYPEHKKLIEGLYSNRILS